MVSLYEASQKIKNGFMSAPIEETGRIEVRCDVDGRDMGIISLGDGTKVTPRLDRDGARVRIRTDEGANHYLFNRKLVCDHSFDQSYPLAIEGRDDLLIEFSAQVNYSVEIRLPIKNNMLGGIAAMCALEADGRRSISKTINTEIEKMISKAIFNIHNVEEIINAIDLNRVQYDEKINELTDLLENFGKKYGISIKINNLVFKWKPSYLNAIAKIKEDEELKAEYNKQLEMLKNIME